MGIYVDPTDCHDPAVTVVEAHCANADILIAADLANIGVDPSELTLPVAILTLLGSYYATAAACLERSKGEDTTLINKAQMYSMHAKTLASKLSRAGLGLATDAATGGGSGYCRVRRG